MPFPVQDVQNLNGPRLVGEGGRVQCGIVFVCVCGRVGVTTRPKTPTDYRRRSPAFPFQLRWQLRNRAHFFYFFAQPWESGMVIFELNHGATRHKFIEDFSFLTSRICLIQALKCPKMTINVYFHFFMPSFYVCSQQRLKIPGDRILDRRTIINPIQAGEGGESPPPHVFGEILVK